MLCNEPLNTNCAPALFLQEFGGIPVSTRLQNGIHQPKNKKCPRRAEKNLQRRDTTQGGGVATRAAEGAAIVPKTPRPERWKMKLLSLWLCKLFRRWSEVRWRTRVTSGWSPQPLLPPRPTLGSHPIPNAEGASRRGLEVGGIARRSALLLL